MGTDAILVTGSEGFIGSHLVRYLEAQKLTVIGGYKVAPQRADAYGSTKLVQCDLTNAGQVADVVTAYRPKYIFHLAAQSLPTASWADPVYTFQANILGSLHLFEAARRLRQPPLIISACSSAEYGPVSRSAAPVSENHALHPVHPYGITKVCVDLMARQYFTNYSTPTVTLRLFNTTGPGKEHDAPSDFVRQLSRIRKKVQQPVIRVGNLTSRRAFLDVRDTVRAFYLAAQKARLGEVYNVCANRAYSIRELLTTAIRISGERVRIESVPQLMRPSDERIIFGNTTKFRKRTGWRPLISLEQTLMSMFEYWDERPGQE